jgi:hypothetical protein
MRFNYAVGAFEPRHDLLLHPMTQPDIDIFIFFKHYDPTTQVGLFKLSRPQWFQTE